MFFHASDKRRGHGSRERGLQKRATFHLRHDNSPLRWFGPDGHRWFFDTWQGGGSGKPHPQSAVLLTMPSFSRVPLLVIGSKEKLIEEIRPGLVTPNSNLCCPHFQKYCSERGRSLKGRKNGAPSYPESCILREIRSGFSYLKPKLFTDVSCDIFEQEFISFIHFYL